METSIYKTDLSGNRLSLIGTYNMEYKNVDIIREQNHPADVEEELINIHPDVEYHTFGGIDGAFTDSAACAWSAMPKDKMDELTPHSIATVIIS